MIKYQSQKHIINKTKHNSSFFYILVEYFMRKENSDYNFTNKE